MSTQAIATNAMASLYVRTACSLLSSATRCTLRASSEQSCWPNQQDDCHDDEDHGVGCFGKEHLRKPLDHAQAESRQDSAHNRTHAAEHHHREHDDDQVRTHLLAYVVVRRWHHARERRQGNAEAVGERAHARHVNAAGAYEGRIFGCGAQIRTELRALDDEPSRKTYGK